MTDAEWEDRLQQLRAQEAHILALPPSLPDPGALRCVHSSHRTLAHLRACQETWMEAARQFQEKPGKRVKLLHPWRLFDQKSYATVPWEEHLAAFVADRKTLLAFLASADRSRGGKLNANDRTIEMLVDILTRHEHYHLFEPR